MTEENEGIIYLIHGEGKGKTTFSIGLALKFLGYRKRIGMVQFMKGYLYSECSVLDKLESISLFQTGTPFFVKKGYPSAVDLNESERGLRIAESLLEKPEYDMVILDEINVAVDYGLLNVDDVVSIMGKRTSRTTVVLTGQNPPSLFFDLADMIIEMKEIKHPFSTGLMARKGIDY